MLKLISSRAYDLKGLYKSETWIPSGIINILLSLRHDLEGEIYFHIGDHNLDEKNWCYYSVRFTSRFTC